jgi:hypothetical protein
MARRHFAVALRALHVTTKTAHLQAEITTGSSEEDVIARGLRGIRQALKEEDGWSDHVVITRRVPMDLIKQVTREAQWFDPTGAHRLYCVAVYIGNGDGSSALLVASVMAFCESGARDEARAYVRKHHPETEGWSMLGCDIEEFRVPRRESARTAIAWVPRGTTTH